MNHYSLEYGDVKYFIVNHGDSYDVLKTNKYGGQKLEVLKSIAFPSSDAYPGGVEESWWLLDVMHHLQKVGEDIFEKGHYGIHDDKKVKVVSREDELVVMVDGCDFIISRRSIRCPLLTEDNQTKHAIVYHEIYDWLSCARGYLFYPPATKVITVGLMKTESQMIQSGLSSFLEVWTAS